MEERKLDELGKAFMKARDHSFEAVKSALKGESQYAEINFLSALSSKLSAAEQEALADTMYRALDVLLHQVLFQLEEAEDVLR